MYTNRENNIWKTADWVTILLYILLLTAGWFSICGASYEFDSPGLFDPSGRPGSQLIWIGLSAILIFVIMMMEKNFYDYFAYLIYFIIILLLVVTILFAPEIKGSRSWLAIGQIRVQPAEFAKFATALAVAKLMNDYGFRLNSLKNYCVTLSLILLPMALILLQKEAGSALVYLAFFLVLYREGMSGYVLLAGFCTVLYFVTAMKYSAEIAGITPLGEFIVSCMILLFSIGLVFIRQKDKKRGLVFLAITALGFLGGYAVSLYTPVNFVWVSCGLTGVIGLYLAAVSFLKQNLSYLLVPVFALCSLAFLYSSDYVFDKVLEPHQQVRIKVALGLENDLSGAGYNVNQSKIAIGSGGLTGKGFLNGTQTLLKYVPEQDTDFIFCTIGEEQGFIGSIAVLILFAAFIIRLVILAERQNSKFGRVYGYSVASVFFFHYVINIGMVTGLTPVIGIPLPFFSYGGSSLWGFTILLFIFLKLDASRKER